MNEWSMQFGYEPKCTCYPKKTRKGLVFYYLRYYLPGGKRVSKAVGDKKSLARKLMFEKEQNLRKGVFDAFDLERIPESKKVRNPFHASKAMLTTTTGAGKKSPSSISINPRQFGWYCTPFSQKTVCLCHQRCGEFTPLMYLHSEEAIRMGFLLCSLKTAHSSGKLLHML